MREDLKAIDALAAETGVKAVLEIHMDTLISSPSEMCIRDRPTTRRLSPFGSISLRETARTVTGPTGAGILPSPSRLCRAGSPTAKTRTSVSYTHLVLPSR